MPVKPTNRAAKEWTTMFYLAGDFEDLEGLVDHKLNDLRRVGATANVEAIAKFDRPGRQRTRCLRVLTNGDEGVGPEMDEINTGDKRELIAFADLARRSFPSNRSAIIAWGHGNSLDPEPPTPHHYGFRHHGAGRGEPRPLSPANSAMFPKGAVARLRDMQANHCFLLPDLHTYSSSFDMWAPDGAAGDYLDNAELKEAFEEIADQKPINIIGLDACLMNTIEVAYQLRGLTNVLIASQSKIPIAGWCYDLVLRSFGDSSMDDEAIAKGIVDAGSSIATPDEHNTTLSALRMNRIDEVADAISRLAEVMRDAMTRDNNAFDAIADAHYDAQYFVASATVDLVDFCVQLERHSTNPSIRSASETVRAATCQMVIANFKKGATVRSANGISILLPKYKHLSAPYLALDFACKNEWTKFLLMYLSRLFPSREELQRIHNARARLMHQENT